MGKITAPEPITAAHILADFDCGTASLNDWLKRQALKNEISGASRTFGTCKDLQVVGFYALAVGSVLKDAVIRTIKAANHAGIRALVVHALSEEAKKFYLQHGFLESPLHHYTLMLPLTGEH